MHTGKVWEDHQITERLFLTRRVWAEGGRGLKEDFHLLLYTFFYSLNFVRNA